MRQANSLLLFGPLREEAHRSQCEGHDDFPPPELAHRDPDALGVGKATRASASPYMRTRQETCLRWRNSQGGQLALRCQQFVPCPLKGALDNFCPEPMVASEQIVQQLFWGLL